jgi:hypothetical protein
VPGVVFCVVIEPPYTNLSGAVLVKIRLLPTHPDTDRIECRTRRIDTIESRSCSAGVGAIAVLCTIYPRSGVGRHSKFLSPLEETRPRGLKLRDRSHNRYACNFIRISGAPYRDSLWAWLFKICGDFHKCGTAYHHSAVNCTILGYGGLIMTPSWRLLGSIEAADGALMFGVSTRYDRCKGRR